MKVFIFIAVYLLIGCFTDLAYLKIYDRLGEDRMMDAVRLYQRLTDEEALKLLRYIEMACLYAWPFIWAVIIYCHVYWYFNKH